MTYLIHEEGPITNGFTGLINNVEEVKELVDSMK